MSCGCGIPTPIASDLERLTFRLESVPYVANSRNRFGRDIVGHLRKPILYVVIDLS